MVFSSFAPALDINVLELLLKTVQFGWFAAAIIIFYLVYKTYRAFPETDIKVGMIGFFLIMCAYALTTAILITGYTTAEMEIAANVIVALGYGAVALAAGWIK